MLVAVLAIAAGWDTGLLTRLSYASTNRVEQSLLDAFIRPGLPWTLALRHGPHNATVIGMITGGVTEATSAPPVEGRLPSLGGAVAWLNSPPLSPESLRGRVVLIDFWTYSCINCLRTLPYLKAWDEQLQGRGAGHHRGSRAGVCLRAGRGERAPGHNGARRQLPGGDR